METVKLVSLLVTVVLVAVHPSEGGTLQSAGVKGRVVCGSKNEDGVKVKLVDVDRFGKYCVFSTSQQFIPQTVAVFCLSWHLIRPIRD